MGRNIWIQKVWFDDDVIALEIEVNDGKSKFVNDVFVSPDKLKEVIKNLAEFSDHIHDGQCEFKFGEFSPEYASGAFQATLYFDSPGKLIVNTWQQYDFENISGNVVANEAKIYLATEPVLFDNFIMELKELDAGERQEATLKCM